jgi:hypothetical protein
VADEIPGLRGAGRRVGSAPAVEPSNGRSCSGRDSTWTHNAAQGGRCPSCGKETTAPPCEALSDWHDPTSPWWQQEEVSDDRPA